MERYLHVSWCLTGLSALLVSAGVRRAVAKRVHADRFMEYVTRLVREHNLPRAIKLCTAGMPGAVPHLVRRALLRITALPREEEPLREALTALFDEERDAVEAGLSVDRFYLEAACLLLPFAALYDPSWTLRAGVPFFVAAGACAVGALVGFWFEFALREEIQRSLVALFGLLVEEVPRLKNEPPAEATVSPPVIIPPPQEAPVVAPPKPATTSSREPLYLTIYRGTAPAVTIRHAKIPAVLKVGRADSCDLHVDDPKVARMHAVLALNDGRLEAIDLGSQEGTFLNEERVTKAALRHGDIVRIGTTRIAVGFGAPPPVIEVA